MVSECHAEVYEHHGRYLYMVGKCWFPQDHRENFVEPVMTDVGRQCAGSLAARYPL